MKKIISIIALLFILVTEIKAQSVSTTYTPQITKDFSTDSLSGLDKKIRILSINIDIPTQKVTVTYEIILVSNTGYTTRISNASYIRDNTTTAKNFTGLLNSAIGIDINASLTSDLSKIHSFKTLINDLKQP